MIFPKAKLSDGFRYVASVIETVSKQSNDPSVQKNQRAGMGVEIYFVDGYNFNTTPPSRGPQFFFGYSRNEFERQQGSNVLDIEVDMTDEVLAARKQASLDNHSKTIRIGNPTVATQLAPN